VARRSDEELVGAEGDQAWFWTSEWQAMEREVDEDRAAGIPDRGFASGEEFLACRRRSVKIVSPTYARESAFARDFAKLTDPLIGSNVNTLLRSPQW